MTQKKVKLRHNKILNELKRKGSVELKNLADKFGYHEMTIRRDLKKLEEMGYLVRTLGGACLVPSRFLGYSSKADQDLNWDLKQKIVEHVSENLIEEDDKIFLTSGVTMLQLVKQLHKDHENLHLYTNSVDIVSYEYGNIKFKLSTTGGHLRPDSPCFYGVITKTDLKLLKGNIDKVFIEVDAVVNEDGFQGFMQYNNFEASIYDLIFDLVEPDNIYVLADKTKFEKLALFQVGTFDQMNKLITNQLEPEVYENFEDLVNLVQVEDKKIEEKK